MGRLTTHVLDTAQGCPADGIALALYRVSGNSHRKIAEAVTNADGRCDAPLLEGAKFKPGTYELVFFAGDYFDAQNADLPDPKFVDQVPIRFRIADPDGHYHVPLLLSPFGYSTYRGS